MPDNVKTTRYQKLLEQIRAAYVSAQTGALRPSVWKREGASSYTVKREQSTSERGRPMPDKPLHALERIQLKPRTTVKRFAVDLKARIERVAISFEHPGQDGYVTGVRYVLGVIDAALSDYDVRDPGDVPGTADVNSRLAAAAPTELLSPRELARLLEAERAKVAALHVAYRKRGAMLERSIAMLRESHKDLCAAQMAFGGYAGHGSNLISGATADIGKFLESLDAKEEPPDAG